MLGITKRVVSDAECRRKRGNGTDASVRQVVKSQAMTKAS